MRRARRRWIVTLAAGGLALAGCEVFLRWWGEEVAAGYPRGLQARDDEVGFRLSPGFEGDMTAAGRNIPVATNTRGFRDDELGDSPRVLSLGDSFCFGHGVRAEDTYSELLEAELVRGGASLQVINMGAPGYNTWNALRLLREDGPSLEPSLVLLGLYVGNDITGNHEDRVGRLVVRSKLLVRKKPDTWEAWLSFKSFAGSHSLLATKLARLPIFRDDGPRGRPSRCEAILWDQGFALGVMARERPPEIQEAFDCTERALLALRDECIDRLGVPLCVVLLPGPHQYKPKALRAVLRACAWKAEDFDVERPQRELARRLASLGVPTLDLLPLFRERTLGGARLHLDVHFNEEGHRLAAEAIAPFLEESGLVP